jgi:hypothetical protein
VASSRGIDTFIIGMPHRYVGVTLIFSHLRGWVFPSTFHMFLSALMI